MRLLSLLFLITSAASAQDAAELIRQGDAADKLLHTQEALAAYAKADELLPNQTDTLCLIAKEWSLSMGDMKDDNEKIAHGNKALEFARRALSLNSNDAHVQLTLAVCYGRLAPLVDNRTKIAYSKQVKEHADEALRLNPGDDLTLHVLGAWNYELANLNVILRTIATALYGHLPAASNADAEHFLKKAMELNPGRIANHYVMGKVWQAEGNKASARAEWQRALDLPSREKDDETLKAKTRELLRKL